MCSKYVKYNVLRQQQEVKGKNRNGYYMNTRPPPPLTFLVKVPFMTPKKTCSYYRRRRGGGHEYFRGFPGIEFFLNAQRQGIKEICDVDNLQYSTRRLEQTFNMKIVLVSFYFLFTFDCLTLLFSSVLLNTFIFQFLQKAHYLYVQRNVCMYITKQGRGF